MPFRVSFELRQAADGPRGRVGIRQDDHHPRADGLCRRFERRGPRLPERRGAGQGRGRSAAPLADVAMSSGRDERVQSGQDHRLQIVRRWSSTGRRREGRPGAVHWLLELVGISGQADRYPHEFSAACASELRSRSRSRASRRCCSPTSGDGARRHGAAQILELLVHLPATWACPDPRHARPAGRGPGVRPRRRDGAGRSSRWGMATIYHDRGIPTRACCSRRLRTCWETRTWIDPGAPRARRESPAARSHPAATRRSRPPTTHPRRLEITPGMGQCHQNDHQVAGSRRERAEHEPLLEVDGLVTRCPVRAAWWEPSPPTQGDRARHRGRVVLIAPGQMVALVGESGCGGPPQHRRWCAWWTARRRDPVSRAWITRLSARSLQPLGARYR
jgi:hypothetical protein